MELPLSSFFTSFLMTVKATKSLPSQICNLPNFAKLFEQKLTFPFPFLVLSFEHFAFSAHHFHFCPFALFYFLVSFLSVHLLVHCCSAYTN